jgi:phosphoglycolate phosphatase-like HAD superfamily hydrolase
MMACLLIFDGDNTLWDTNEVFESAQKRMLKVLQARGFPAEPDRDFTLLRRLDDRLIFHFGTHRYGARYLGYALIRYFRDQGDDISASLIGFETEAEDIKSLVSELEEQFHRDVVEIPRLFPRTLEDLDAIRRKGHNCLVLYSDASRTRLHAICSHYRMSDYFDLIENGDKSEEDWGRVWKVGRRQMVERFSEAVQYKTYVIGDLLKYDIVPGNRLGAVTIYKPGGYRGTETPQDPSERPALTVQTLAQILDLL